MYIINDTYFQSLNREVPNIEEADSKSFSELERIIDEKCRLLMFDFLTVDEFSEFDSYLVDGLFPENAQPDPLLPNYVPAKWIDLVKGKEYEVNNIKFKWKGLIYNLGTYKGSLLADYVYYWFLTENVSYMTGVGDAKANPKGANLVNPTQRIVKTWNDFVLAYQGKYIFDGHWLYDTWFVNGFCENKVNEVSLVGYINSQSEDFPYRHIKSFEVKNQLGL